MKIVLDTNCLLAILPRKSRYRCLWETFLQGDFTLCCTTEMIQEYEELLSRFYSPVTTLVTMEILLNASNVVHIIPYYKWNLIFADPDDNKFVDCALNAGADYIVTNDRHFNVLKEISFPKITVINIDTFKQVF